MLHDNNILSNSELQNNNILIIFQWRPHDGSVSVSIIHRQSMRSLASHSMHRVIAQFTITV